MTVEQIINTICKPLSDSPSLSAYVQMAEDGLSSGFFGKKYPYAVAYKACHLFTMMNGEGSQLRDMGNGSIQSYSEGGISVSFGNGNSGKELASTKYGQMLLDLMKTIPTMNVNRSPLC